MPPRNELFVLFSIKNGCIFDLLLEPEEIEGYASTVFFCFHLGLSEKHIIFEIGDNFFSTCPDPPRNELFVLYSIKNGGIFDLQLEPEEIEGYAAHVFFFFHLGLSEKNIIFEIGDNFFSTFP